MRGVFLHQQLEFRLEVANEDLRQGDHVHGTFSVKNHGSAHSIPSAVCVCLCSGDAKKIKAKAEDAFTRIVSAEIEHAFELPPHATHTQSWSIQLDKNCPITDRDRSPYLLYGDSSFDSSLALGQLLLSVSPHPHIKAVIDTMESVFNCTNRGLTSRDGCVVAKLRTPDSRRLSLVEELNLSFTFHEHTLNVGYQFKVKRFDTTTPTGVDIKKGKVIISQSWQASDYLFGDDFIHQEFVERSIGEALEAVSTGF